MTPWGGGVELTRTLTAHTHTAPHPTQQVGTAGMPGILKVLEADREDTESVVAALETLDLLCVSSADDVWRGGDLSFPPHRGSL